MGKQRDCGESAQGAGGVVKTYFCAEADQRTLCFRLLWLFCLQYGSGGASLLIKADKCFCRSWYFAESTLKFSKLAPDATEIVLKLEGDAEFKKWDFAPLCQVAPKRCGRAATVQCTAAAKIEKPCTLIAAQLTRYAQPVTMNRRTPADMRSSLVNRRGERERSFAQTGFRWWLRIIGLQSKLIAWHSRLTWQRTIGRSKSRSSSENKGLV